MITLEPEFIETKYPGYFWHKKDHQLYSIKIDGVLKPLKRQKFTARMDGGKLIRKFCPNYPISVNNVRKIMIVKDLMKLNDLETDHVIPVRN